MKKLELNLSREQFEIARIKAVKQGITLIGDSAKDEKQHGVEFSFDYQEPELKITIKGVSIVDKISGYTEDRIAEILTGTLKQGENS